MNYPEGLPTIHYTEMPERVPGESFFQETQTFRRELPRLLADGHEGKWVLIHGDQVIEVCETLDEAFRAGRQRYSFEKPFIVQPIREWQPVIRTRR